MQKMSKIYVGFSHQYLSKHFAVLFIEYNELLQKSRYDYGCNKVYYEPSKFFDDVKLIKSIDGCEVDIKDIIQISNEHNVPMENIRLTYEYCEDGSIVEVKEIIPGALNQNYDRLKAQYDQDMKNKAKAIKERDVRNARLAELSSIFDSALDKLL